jgi:hypothetical protein
MSTRVTHYCPHCTACVRITKDNRYFKHKLSWSARRVCPLSGQSSTVTPPETVVKTAQAVAPAPTVEPPCVELGYTYNDGGRSKYATGRTGDCVARAISIAARLDYKTVWCELQARGAKDPDKGVHKRVWSKYLKALGFKWVSCGKRGRTNLEHVPASGVVILRQRRHLCAVIDGVLHDTYTTHNKTITGYYTR